MIDFQSLLSLEHISRDLLLLGANLIILIIIVFLIIKHFLHVQKIKKWRKLEQELQARDLFSERVSLPVHEQAKEDLAQQEQRKKGTGYIIEDSFTPSIARWGRKRKFNLDGELAYLHQELNSVQKDLSTEYGTPAWHEMSERERARTILEEDLSKLQTQIKAYKRRFPKMKEKFAQDQEFAFKLAEVEKDLHGRPRTSPTSLAESFSTLKKRRREFTRLPSKNAEQMHFARELAHIDSLLDQSTQAPESFLGRVKKKLGPAKRETPIEHLAIDLVKKISSKVEGDHPIPPQELDHVNAQLQRIKEELRMQERWRR